MTETKERTVVARTTSGRRVDSGYPSLTEEALGQLKAPVSPRPTHPYVHQHSPGSGGRVYDPDPVAANGCGNMMYRGYFLEQLGHLRRISGDAKYDQPFDLVYDDEIRYRYSAEQIAAGLCEQFKAPMDANGSSLRPGIRQGLPHLRHRRRSCHAPL